MINGNAKTSLYCAEITIIVGKTGLDGEYGAGARAM
jgi:hypothetical protein